MPNLDGNDPLAVHAKIENQSWWAPLCQFDAYLWVNVHWKSKLENGPPPEDIDFYIGPWGWTEQASMIACEDNQFTATWDYDDMRSPHIHLKGDMTLDYDPETNTIVSFSCYQVITYKTIDGIETETFAIAGGGLPNTQGLDNAYSNRIIYSVQGSEVHSLVTDLNYSYDGVDTYQTLNHGPKSDSENRIEVIFHTQ